MLRDISFTVESGPFISLIGPSGCGKSTLLRIIAGSTAGSVQLGGERCGSRIRSWCTSSRQYTKPIPWKTVMANARFGLQHGATSLKSERIAEARSMLSKVGLPDVERYYPYQLSGGMQQRLALASALVCEPSILLMDEPSRTSTPSEGRVAGFRSSNSGREFGLSIVYVTQDIDEALFLSQGNAGHVTRAGRDPGTFEVDLATQGPGLHAQPAALPRASRARLGLLARYWT